MSGNDLPEAEAREILALEKFMSPDDLFWTPSPNQSAQMIFSTPIVDANGISIRGLMLELSYRDPPQFDDCKYGFTILSFPRKRAIQLEVIPTDHRGHNGGDEPDCYGPHLHLGKHVEEIRIGNLDCKHHESWFREFLKIANIGYGGRYRGPFDGRLI
ncbi:hypothetical protein [Stenotrophobium rhamnosiphilum]|uniref:Uncharacterized protein n=1 Tax=Stenotrophobium rhamnosiphilum TaxID=2029166 RepID=A0A2T5MDI0_9GAMM|nr:hypothetical protein [Stenotrophobium rhamnosiphilum]PTU30641.1 hypothetical protein CJD38_14155 [Stenotrophobium rhamnosiphilum]